MLGCTEIDFCMSRLMVDTQRNEVLSELNSRFVQTEMRSLLEEKEHRRLSMELLFVARFFVSSTAMMAETAKTEVIRALQNC